jgi:hypothetical protein
MNLYPGKEVLYKGRSWWVGKMLARGCWLERPGASIWFDYFDINGLTPVE